jgi:hypothetical protein
VLSDHANAAQFRGSTQEKQLMPTELLERPTISTRQSEDHKILHVCANCAQKERVYVTAPNGRQTAAIWRCRILSQKTQIEVIVQPEENCFEHRSLTDHWTPSDRPLAR